jgi:hypothetical protein
MQEQINRRGFVFFYFSFLIYVTLVDFKIHLCAGKADVCEPEHAGREQQLHQVRPHPDQGQMENGHHD